MLRILRFKEYEIVRKDLSFPSSSLAPGLYYGKAGLGVNFFPFSKPLLTILGVGYSLGTRLDGKLLKFFWKHERCERFRFNSSVAIIPIVGYANDIENPAQP